MSKNERLPFLFAGFIQPIFAYTVRIRFVGFLQKRVFALETDDGDDCRDICHEIRRSPFPFPDRVCRSFRVYYFSTVIVIEFYESPKLPPFDSVNFSRATTADLASGRSSSPSFMPLCRGDARARTL